MSALLLIVDFDGTVYRGDEPARRYAWRISRSMAPADAIRYLDLFELYLEHGVASAVPIATGQALDSGEAAALRESVDQWGAAMNLARRCFGVSENAVEAAFLGAREDMLHPSCEVEVIAPLLETLAEVRGAARVVLATNSPKCGLAPLLARLGVAGAFDEVLAGAAKPEGLRALLRHELGQARTEPWHMFCLGDHYYNDIEPAIEIGAAAGYIDRFGRADGPATATAPIVERLLPTLLGWAADPRSAAASTATNE